MLRELLKVRCGLAHQFRTVFHLTYASIACIAEQSSGNSSLVAMIERQVAILISAAADLAGCDAVVNLAQDGVWH